MSSALIKSSGTIDGHFAMPGSKYLANRALIVAALANGQSIIDNVPCNNDINSVLAVLEKMGIALEKQQDRVIINGKGGILQGGHWYVGESGTLMRFCIALATLADSPVEITGSKRIHQRPVGDLTMALRSLAIDCRDFDGCPPVDVYSQGLPGGNINIAGNISSQYISALLLVCPLAQNPLHINITGKLVSRPYVEMTIKVMKDFGAIVEGEKNIYCVDNRHKYQPRHYNISGDWSSASYFFGAAAVMSGKITISGLDLNSVQGEARFVEILHKMGCLIEKENDRITLIGPEKLQAITADLSAMPDIAQTLACVASFASGTTIIRGVGHLRHKECDRLHATVAELRKTGIKALVENDSMIITGGKPKPAKIDSHNDHRMVMSFAIIALKTPGLIIENPQCADKSFPQFWQKWQELGADVLFE